MGIYTDDGWVNIPYIMDKYNPVVCVLAGGRGLGKPMITGLLFDGKLRIIMTIWGLII